MSLKAKLPIWVFVLVVTIGLATSFLLVNYSVSVLSEIGLQSLENVYWTKKISQKDTLANWQTYRNYEYGFEFKLPPRWTNATIEQINDEFYNGEIFLIKLEDKPICDISAYSDEAWKLFQEADTTGKPIYLISRENLIFGWACGHDDYGYKGFEDYNDAVENNNLDAINSGKILGPFAEFKSLILPTFKFIRWKIYRNEEYGFEMKYPANFIVKEYRNTNDTQLIEFSNQISRETFTISFSQLNPKKLDIAAWADQQEWPFPDNWRSHFSIKSVSRLNVLQDPKTGSIILTKGDKIYNIDNGVGINPVLIDLNTFNQILSTFKFIEPIDTSNWKTYRNKEYGFEFNYPPNLIYEEKIHGTFNDLRWLSVYFGQANNPAIHFALEINIPAIGLWEGCETSPTRETVIINDVYFEKEGYCEGENLTYTTYDLSPRKNMYLFLDWNYNNSLFNQILSTFKFIE